jgi:FAD/FMN-containing dehydrogenase
MSVVLPSPSSSAADVSRLRADLRGAAITPDDPAYDDARASWNLAFDTRPALIVEAADVDDVAAALRFAAAADLGVAVQATGHGMARAADDDLLITTRRLDEVTIDRHARTARVGAGALWGPVLAEAQLHGLAPLAGSAPHVGAVGYTLGGGMGWLARKHGLSADKVRSFEVVTPDGQVRRVSAETDPELFWALRGGGAGSLGVVTAMEIDLVAVDQVYAGNLLYPPELAGEVFARFREWVRDVPDELTSAVVVMNFPPFEEVPEPVRGRSFAMLRGCWCGPLEDGAALIDEWRDWTPPALDLFGPMPFAQMAEISQDPVDPVPAMVATESLADLDAEASRVLIDHTLPAGGPPALIFSEVRHGGGVLAAADRGAGHARLGEARFITHAVGLLDLEAPEGLADHLASLRQALAPFRSTHAYLNFLDGEERRERTREAFTDEEWARLLAVKAAIDPDDRLRHGLQLPPSA